MSSTIIIAVLLAGVQVAPYGELSPDQDITQWEVSSAVLSPGDADGVCVAPRQPGDMQLFLSYRNDWHRVMSCAQSTLGTGNCLGSGPSTEMASPGGLCLYPGRLYQLYPEQGWAPGDNVMTRLTDGRIVQVVQTAKVRCPRSDEDGIDNDGDGVIDEGDEYPFCRRTDVDQIAYVTRVTDDCGGYWEVSGFGAAEVKDLAGNPLTPPRWRGFDRVEMYADPWSDEMLLTAQAGAGECGGTQNTVFFHASMPPGELEPQWELMFSDDYPSVPTAMTSLPHTGGASRVYWFNCEPTLRTTPKGTFGHYYPKLLFGDDPWNLPVTGSNPPHELYLTDFIVDAAAGETADDYECRGLPSSCRLCDPASTDPNCPPFAYECCGGGCTPGETPIRNLIGNNNIVRISTDGIGDVVRIAYPQLKIAAGEYYQVLRILDLEISPDGAGGFTASKVADRTIDPTLDPASRGSAFYPSIVQVDVATPQDPDAATHLLRWTEIGDAGITREKYVAWDPTNGFSPIGELDAWTCFGDCSTGDYQYGAFIDAPDECTHRFFAPWGVQKDVNGDGMWGAGDAVKTHGAILTTSTDGEAPVLDPAPEDATVECDAIPDAPALAATDNCDDEPEVIADEVSFPGSCPQSYTLTRRWTATDNVGQVAVETQTLTVEDTTPPVLDPAPADVTVECDAVPAAAQLDAADSCDDDPALDYAENRINGSCPSSYALERTWTATDACGNESTEAQTVTVQDTAAPVVMPGADDLYCLWPPNHDYVCFGREQFAPAIADNCGTTDWLFAGCASDQPEDADGDGHTLDDCVVSADGSGFCVRAERAGSIEAGRRYAVSIVAVDECGNASAPTVIGNVHVPRDAADPALCLQP